MRRACSLQTLLLTPQILSLAAPEGADVRTFAAYLKGCILPMFARGSVDIKDLQAGPSKVTAFDNMPTLWPA